MPGASEGRISSYSGKTEILTCNEVAGRLAVENKLKRQMKKGLQTMHSIVDSSLLVQYHNCAMCVVMHQTAIFIRGPVVRLDDFLDFQAAW